MSYTFPFGRELRPLVQQDRSPKKVFVLGVYASAVHARWKKDGKIISQALAVASEPYIFWNGDPNEAREIIDSIRIPPEAGCLEPAGNQLNGPSAKVLDELILSPLGFSRSDAWLCDMLPEARLNPNQKKVIKEKYEPMAKMYGLPTVTVPDRPSSAGSDSFCDAARCREIIEELEYSEANTVVLLGDLPIKQFLRKAASVDYSTLGEYVERYGYAQPSDVLINGKTYSLIPLAHPRQIGGLGTHSDRWFNRHREWMSGCSASAPELKNN